MSYLIPLIAVVFVVVVGCYLASIPHEKDHQYIIVILGLIVPLIIVAIGVEAFWKKICHSDIRSSLSSGCLHEEIVNFHLYVLYLAVPQLLGFSSDVSKAGFTVHRPVVWVKVNSIQLNWDALEFTSQVFLNGMFRGHIPVSGDLSGTLLGK
ncbi:hypothetical protein Tco_1217896 [Tanacetum coccineum]